MLAEVRRAGGKRERMSVENELTERELSEIDARLAAATPGPWRWDSFGSGTEYVHMRNASGRTGPRIMGPDHSDQDGHVGAHMFLHNVSAFQALTGEDERGLEREKAANAEFIAHARDDVPRLLAEVRRLRVRLGGGRPL